MAFALTSPHFDANGGIPARFTCEGQDISPALQWTNPPAGTRSFALIVDDPDAPDPARPQRTWVHWVLYNLPASVRSLEAGVGAEGTLPSNTTQGLNDWKRAGYGGPCPPIGRHRYIFKLYALDRALEGASHMTKADLEQAMKGHILAQAELVGTYAKGQAGSVKGTGR
jgi:Raf kinase inhibitor-like YbhB/YbcL family protein